jgi:allantoate deiminase
VFDDAALEVIRRCRVLAGYSEDPAAITRRSLSAPMRQINQAVGEWMRALRMVTRIDAGANLRGVLRGTVPDGGTFYLASHLDTVPDAGAFDGILGVVWALAVLETLPPAALPFDVEVIGFSDEEGVRFGMPFIGSRALVGTLDAEALARRDETGVTLDQALRSFGADPDERPAARFAPDAFGYLECHIEQGPVLDDRGCALGVVDAIAGQTRADVVFVGAARHAGTTPMARRRDSVAAAAEWVVAVEAAARGVGGAVATVGRIAAEPGAGNVIAGRCRLSLDVRHEHDAVRRALVVRLRGLAEGLAQRRGLDLEWHERLDQPAVGMDVALGAGLERAARTCGFAAVRMTSGAGHDAMIVAPHLPSAMLFVRSPGGVSHHPGETVRAGDVAAAIAVGRRHLLDLAEARHA